MAVNTKATAVLVAAGTSNAAGASTTIATQSLATTLGQALITALVTNGGTGPTIAATVLIQASWDGGTSWKTLRQFPTALGAGVTTSIIYEVSEAVELVGVIFTSNTAQAVTVEAQIGYITAIS